MRGKPFRLIRETAKKTLTIPKGARVEIKKREKIGALTVNYVDGSEVRKKLDPYFMLGGHDLIYAYIPKNNIWIDLRVHPKDLKYTLIHEMDERARMSKGMAYHDAHDFAIAAERAARRKDGVADFITG